MWASVTLAVTVTGTPGTPTGTVIFKDGTTKLSTASLASGAASYSTSALAAGLHSITATYAGDSIFNGAVSSAQTVAVSLTTPTVTLTAPATALVGASVTLAVTVTVAGTPGTPTGSVTFKDGTATLSTATLASGIASFSTTALAAGAHTITASYSGDSIFGAATSAASTVTINVAPAITLVAQPSSLTIPKGSSGNLSIFATPAGCYAGTVSFTCGPLPAGASCNFAPFSLIFSGNNSAASTTLTFSTVTTVARVEQLPGRAVLAPVFAALMLLPLGLPHRRKSLRGGLVACSRLYAIVQPKRACDS